MTIIAYDGVNLAADKMATNGSLPMTVTKIFKTAIGMIGISGSAVTGSMVKEWLTSTDPSAANFPDLKLAGNTDLESYVLHITNDGDIHFYCDRPYPVVIEDRTYAIGSGRDFAMAAMYLGKTAVEAVEIACHLDVYCGNGIDTLTLDSK